MQGLRGDPVAEARALENVISFHQDYLTYKPPLPPPLPLALVAKAYKELGAVRVRQGPDYFVSLPCISACTHVRRGGGSFYEAWVFGVSKCHYWSCWHGWVPLLVLLVPGQLMHVEGARDQVWPCCVWGGRVTLRSPPPPGFIPLPCTWPPLWAWSHTGKGRAGWEQGAVDSG